MRKQPIHTLIFLSCCHEDDVPPWMPEAWSPLGMRAAGLKAKHVEKVAPPETGGYVKVMNWTTKQRKALTAWRREYGETSQRDGYVVTQGMITNR